MFVAAEILRLQCKDRRRFWKLGGLAGRAWVIKAVSGYQPDSSRQVQQWLGYYSLVPKALGRCGIGSSRPDVANGRGTYHECRWAYCGESVFASGSERTFMLLCPRCQFGLHRSRWADVCFRGWIRSVAFGVSKSDFVYTLFQSSSALHSTREAETPRCDSCPNPNNFEMDKSTKSTMGPPETPAASAKGRPRQRRATADSQVDRKRELDRIAQRMSRERSRNRIVFLEQKLKSLEARDRGGQISYLMKVIEDLRQENTQLRASMMKIRFIADNLAEPASKGRSRQYHCHVPG